MKSDRVKVIIGFLFFVLSQKTEGQSPLHWRLEADIPISSSTQSKTFKDSLELFHALEELVNNWTEEGYLTASVDEVKKDSTQWTIRVFRGPSIQWERVTIHGYPDEVLAYGTDRLRKWSSKPIRKGQLEQLQRDLTRKMVSLGYPFARVEWSLGMESAQNLSADILLQPGGLYLFDTLQWEGDVEISTTFLENFLGLSRGQPFDLERIERIPRRIRELTFLNLAQKPGLLFDQGRYRVFLELEPQRASRFDFLIGILPNSPTTNRLLITGDLEAEFLSAFGRGERLYFSFERLRPETQDLQISATLPYPFQLPLSLKGDFSLYRRDSSFVNVHLSGGVQYEWSPGVATALLLSRRTTNLLSVDTATVIRTNTLPEQLDTRQSGLALSFFINRLDDRFNPRKGYFADIMASAGLRRIRINNDIETTEAVRLYDDLNRETGLFLFTASTAWHFPLFQRSTLRFGLNSGFQWSNAGVLRNEQFRLGGNQLLRGFDEEFFFATAYSIGTLEYRFLLDRNAFLFLFGDYAWIENNQFAVGQTVISPYGFGAGITFETASGLFTLSIASGGQNGQPLDLSAPKVHLGYQSLF